MSTLVAALRAAHHQVAALAEVPASATRAFRVLPSGRFSARDGRPGPGASWNLSQASAQRIIAAAKASAADGLIDYEHGLISNKGSPNPAAGWYRELEWRSDGLWVTDARWTPRAEAMILSGEYRYVSPLIQFDASGEVMALVNIALANYPAITDLTDLSPTAALSTQLATLMAMQPAPTSEQAHIGRLLGLTQEQWQQSLATEQLSAQQGAARMAAGGFEGTGMTDQQQQHFVRVFGHTPAELRALTKDLP